MNSEKYIGLDVHQATICVAVMDAKGKVVMESILETGGSLSSWHTSLQPSGHENGRNWFASCPRSR